MINQVEAASRNPIESQSGLALKEVVRFGPLAIAYGTWGEELTPQQIYEEANMTAPPRIGENGFTGGYHFPLDYDVTTDKSQHELADHVVEIGLAALEARGWQEGRPIRLYFGSTSAQSESTELIAAKLKEKGVTIIKSTGRGFACASGIVSLIDACRDPSNQGVPTLILCGESLSGSIASAPDFRSTFSNGGSALAFIPGDEIELMASTIVVAKDPKDSISLPNFGKYPPHDPSFIPSYYEIDPKATVHASELGIWQEFHHSEDNNAHWNPEDMGSVFKKSIPPPVIWALKGYALRHGLANLQPIALAHQAAKKMVNGIINDTRPRRSINDLISREKTLWRYGKPFQIYAPWVMDKLGISNVSSATTFIAWAELVKNGAMKPSDDPEVEPEHVTITPDKDLMIIAYGIGYSVVKGIIRIKKSLPIG